MFSKCSGCGISIGYHGYCAECKPKVKLAQREAKAIMLRANLPKADGQKCVDCGKRAFHYDHRHYSKPLDVVPVCRTCNMKRGPALDIADVIRNGIHYAPEPVSKPVETPYGDLDADLAEYEADAITDAITTEGGNWTKAAKRLGISFRSIRYRIAKLGIG